MTTTTSFRKERLDNGAIGPSPTRRTRLPRAEPRAPRARSEASRERAEPNRGSDHGLRRVDVVRLHPHHLVQLLDRARRREVPLRALDDDRVARGDLPLDVRD